jgi:hypothetical protein
MPSKKPAGTKPQHLPLIVDCPAGAMDNPALTGAGTPQTITLQLIAKSGQIYLLPLSELAALRITGALVEWEPVKSRLEVRNVD